MAEPKKTSIECDEATKAKVTAAADLLKWTIPQIAALMGDALDVMIAGEETPAQRAARMLNKLTAASGGVRQDSNKGRSRVRQMSDKTLTAVEGESDEDELEPGDTLLALAAGES